MEHYEPMTTFGEREAHRYDAISERGDEVETVDFLEAHARGRAVLELAIGTGRIALPLAARGIAVSGIDLSEPMVAELRGKEGGDQIVVTIGDIADVPVDGTFGLVYLVFNTLFNLLTQEEQARCFHNVASCLDDDGLFVVEAFTPGHLYRLPNDNYVDAEAIGVDEVRLDVARHDPVNQMLEESHVSLSVDGIRLTPIVCRYSWPAEIDLMAEMAGLHRRERWGGWCNEPFTSRSERHVTVYGR